MAAWRLARADRLAAGTGLGPRRRTERGRGPVPNQSGDAQPGGQQVELFAERSYDAAGPGLALIRDGNGTRSFETLLRYRGAAMAEFWRALRTLKALQSEQAAETCPALEAHPNRPAARPPLAHRPQPNQPESAAGRPLEYALPAPPAPGRTLHEARRALATERT